jgi:methylated-DNA-[protein]-cysteine S-methyltransferase
MKKEYVSKRINSPVGRIKLVASDKGLAAILWEDDDPDRVRIQNMTENDSHPVLIEAEKQLKEYFGGRRRVFSMDLDFNGTDFQKKVWKTLLEIPWGETRTYSQIAEQIGNPKAVRAVGAANGKNPISIIAPCHRVIGASGRLTGYAGGLENKALLLKLEQVSFSG